MWFGSSGLRVAVHASHDVPELVMACAITAPVDSFPSSFSRVALTHETVKPRETIQGGLGDSYFESLLPLRNPKKKPASSRLFRLTHTGSSTPRSDTSGPHAGSLGTAFRRRCTACRKVDPPHPTRRYLDPIPHVPLRKAMYRLTKRGSRVPKQAVPQNHS